MDQHEQHEEPTAGEMNSASSDESIKPSPARNGSHRVVSWSALGVAVLALILALGSLLVQRSNSESSAGAGDGAGAAAAAGDYSKNSLFSYPTDVEGLIKKVRASTVTIGCKDFSGSGWVIELGSPDDGDANSAALDKEFPTEVITNHHVIKQCVNSPRAVTATAGDKTYDAFLYSWDKENDLALIGIKQKVPALEISTAPVPGWWTMAIGTPYGLEGSISIGNVINREGNAVISTASLNSGNSGGPLVNSRGQVVGTNSWTYIGEEVAQDWNGSIDLPTLCVEIVNCAKGDALTWGE